LALDLKSNFFLGAGHWGLIILDEQTLMRKELLFQVITQELSGMQRGYRRSISLENARRRTLLWRRGMIRMIMITIKHWFFQLLQHWIIGIALRLEVKMIHQQRTGLLLLLLLRIHMIH